jgi:hypothetical protein
LARHVRLTSSWWKHRVAKLIDQNRNPANPTVNPNRSRLWLTPVWGLTFNPNGVRPF